MPLRPQLVLYDAHGPPGVNQTLFVSLFCGCGCWSCVVVVKRVVAFSSVGLMHYKKSMFLS